MVTALGSILDHFGVHFGRHFGSFLALFVDIALWYALGGQNRSSRVDFCSKKGREVMKKLAAFASELVFAIMVSLRRSLLFRSARVEITFENLLKSNGFYSVS